MNRIEYIGKLNALYVGDKNRLEELITAYDEKDKEIERLNNIINELEKALQLEVLKTRENSEYNKGVVNAFNHTISLISQLKGSDKE